MTTGDDRTGCAADRGGVVRALFAGACLGLIAGSSCGSIESALVTATGFSVPFGYWICIFFFDLAMGVLAGSAWALAFAAVRKRGFETSGSPISRNWFVALFAGGATFLQGVIFLNLTDRNLSSKTFLLVSGSLLLSALLGAGFYRFLKKSQGSTEAFRNLRITLGIAGIELAVLLGAHLNSAYVGRIPDVGRLAVNAAFAAALLLGLYLCDRAGSRLHSMVLPVTRTLSRTGLALAGLGLALNAALWAALQPRFPAAGTEDPAAKAARSGTAGRPRPNVVLISIDTLCATHVGIYGYQKPVSPQLDRLARQGTAFRYGVSQASWTLPSHASMLTGLYPSHHGASQVLTRLGDQALTLAELLRENGYATAAFTGGGWVTADFGFDRGFEVFDESAEQNLHLGYQPMARRLRVPLFPDRSDFACSVSKVKAWLRTRAKQEKPFFLFLHTYEVHNYIRNERRLAPCLGTLGLAYNPAMNSISQVRNMIGNHIIKWSYSASEKDLSYLRTLYDAAILYTDAQLEPLLSELSALGLEQNTLVILTSDHGEGFEPGLRRVLHGGRLHNDQLLVPLIFRLPGIIPADRVLSEPGCLIDIVPTVAEMLAIPAPQKCDGRSLWKVVIGQGAIRSAPVFSEELGFRLNKEYLKESVLDSYRMVSVINGGTKLISSPDQTELYDLDIDPGETRNLAGEQPALRAELERISKDFAENNRPRYSFRRRGGVPMKPITDETRRRLRSLGYF